MQIVELEARVVRVGFRRRVKHASRVRSETDNVVVRCKLSDGSVGYGEGVPREYVTGETADSAVDLLKRSDIPAQLEPCPTFTPAVHLAERLKLAEVTGDDRMCGGNAARCALELAVLDAYGRAFGEPLMNVAKLLSPDLYEPLERVQYSGVMMSVRGWKAKGFALWHRVLGFRHLKMKVGIAGQNDAERVKHVRGWAGSRMNLRVDVNEAWTPETVVEKIRELEPYSLSSIEQPIPHENVACLADVRKQVGTKIMLDESLCSEVDAERAVAGGWCDSFNLRLSKCGGFIPSLRLAELAVRHGLGYQLGCQVGETAILSAAGRHFATSVKGLSAVEGSFDRHLVNDSLTKEDITFRFLNGGWCPMLVGSGLGIPVDADRLDAITTRREVLLGGV